MTAENIKRVRDEVEKGGYTIIWVGADMPCYLLDKPVKLIYEDMDGYPCICDAVYTYDKDDFYHRPYFKRYDGAHMCNCIACKKQ